MFGDKNYLTPQIKRAWLRPDGVPMDTVTHPYDTEEFIEPQDIVEYILANPTRKTRGVLHGFHSKLNAINSDFNDDLKFHEKGKVERGFVYFLGYPSAILQSAGIANLPIELAKSVVDRKKKKHGFPLALLRNLPLALTENVIAVFKSQIEKNVYIIVLEKMYKTENIAIILNCNDRKINVHSIRSIHPREAKSVAVAFVNNGLRWVDKKKALQMISKQQYNAADVTNLLQGKDLTKLIQNFNNPKFSDKILKKDTGPNLNGLESISSIKSNNDIIDLGNHNDLGKWLQGYETNEYAIVLKGDKGAGKSRLLHQFIELFAGKENLKTAFFSLEIDKQTGIAEAMKKEYFSPISLVNIDCTSNSTSISDLERVAQSGIYKCIAIDSFTKLQNFQQSDFEKLRKSYPKIIWVVIFQSTTGKVVRGGNMPEYDSSVVVQVNKGGFAVQEKNRYGNTDKTYSVFEQKIVVENKA